MPTWHDSVGPLTFDRDALTAAALHAFIESALTRLDPHRRLPFHGHAESTWDGDLQHGAVFLGNGQGDYQVLGWNPAGVVGFAFELGFGPQEEFGLEPDAITGGPDDVRHAVAGLPAALDSALVKASAQLLTDDSRLGERLASVGFWVDANEVGGSLFDEPEHPGARVLRGWGLLESGVAPGSARDANAEIASAQALESASLVKVIDDVFARARLGPTELTTEELEVVFEGPPPHADELVPARRALAQAGITWPGSPPIPPLVPQGRSPFLPG